MTTHSASLEKCRAAKTPMLLKTPHRTSVSETVYKKCGKNTMFALNSCINVNKLSVKEVVLIITLQTYTWFEA
jgi:hypothetical protein